MSDGARKITVVEILEDGQRWVPSNRILFGVSTTVEPGQIETLTFERRPQDGAERIVARMVLTVATKEDPS